MKIEYNKSESFKPKMEGYSIRFSDKVIISTDEFAKLTAIHVKCLGGNVNNIPIPQPSMFIIHPCDSGVGIQIINVKADIDITIRFHNNANMTGDIPKIMTDGKPIYIEGVNFLFEE